MKCYKIWVRETTRIRINGVDKEIPIVAGSNVSKEDAAARAGQIARKVELRIANPDMEFEAYESDIVEHIAREIDPKNIVTINRYGAQVLNTTRYTILDFDRYRAGFLDLFRPRKGSEKDKIVAKFKQRAARFPELGDSFRIYETCKGIRVIGKDYFDPTSVNFYKIMRTLGVDQLYRILCREQNCYRARLTPKPFRMKMETIKIKSPLDCKSEHYETWRAKYESASQNFSVVKLRECIGRDFGNDPVIQLHDQTARMGSNDPLA